METDSAMTCYSLEELVAFAENPLCDSNAAIASHVFVCPECSREFKQILETLPVPTNCTQEEIHEVRNFLAKRIFRRSLWNKLRELLAVLPVLPESSSQDLLPGTTFASGNRTATSNSTFVTTQPVSDRSPASFPSMSMGRRTAYSGGTGMPVKIIFAAKCDRVDPFYWRAELELPPTPSPSTELKIILTDNLGEKIPFGTLVLFGSQLQVRNGVATMEYSAFCQGLGTPQIQFVFLAGKISDGDLVFL